MINRDLLTVELLRDEGLRLMPYTDTVGKLTIGIGRNLTDRGISKDEALVLLSNDVNSAILELEAGLPVYFRLDSERQRALVNMCFNMGLPKLLTFKQFIAALERGDYSYAADEMLDSLWARQVGARALRLSHIIRGE